MIRHIVSWKLAAEDEAGKAESFAIVAAELGSLPAVIPGVHNFRIARDLGETPANWDVVLVIDFDSSADLDLYQTHPAHVVVVGRIKPHFAVRAAVDFEL